MPIEHRFALLGYPLGHSFSQKYFTQKFQDLGLADTHVFDLLEWSNLDNCRERLAQVPHLRGFSVTIPYKQQIIPFLDQLDEAAEAIGAVNTVKVLPDGQLKGYNTDVYGFAQSLFEQFQSNSAQPKALILGKGGAALAVDWVLKKHQFETTLVSRKDAEWAQLNEATYVQAFQLIVNCTPLGTFPNIDTCPPLNYSALSDSHFCFDLVYNPADTLFLKQAQANGAGISNGLDMLHLQAEKAWQIYNEL